MRLLYRAVRDHKFIIAPPLIFTPWTNTISFMHLFYRLHFRKALTNSILPSNNGDTDYINSQESTKGDTLCGTNLKTFKLSSSLPIL